MDLIPQMRVVQVYPYVMPLMSKKKQPFIIDENLTAKLKPHLPADAKTTVECGVRKGTPDYPFVLDLCQREEAMLVTADVEFPRHIKRYPSRMVGTCSMPFCLAASRRACPAMMVFSESIKIGFVSPCSRMLFASCFFCCLECVRAFVL
jgi:hypothetical protein